MTEAERWVWQMLRSHQMKELKFRRQVPIGPTCRLCVPRAYLIVGIDGGQSSRLQAAGRLIPACRKPRFSTSQHGRVRPRDPTTRRTHRYFAEG
jgi:hypothetical protein